MARNQVDRTFDYEMQFKDAGLVGASAAAQVDSSDQILDLGSAQRVDAAAIVDVTALEVADDDELYDLIVQASASSTFASGIQNLAQLSLGSAGGHTTRGDGAALDTIGHYEIPFTNEQNGVRYRYLRMFTIVAGTITNGINYIAHMGTKA